MKLQKLSASLILLSCSLHQTAANWTQGSNGHYSIVPAAYNNSSQYYNWRFSRTGSFSGNVTSSEVKCQANTFDAEAYTYSVHGGSKLVNEHPHAQSYSLWTWTGTPGTAPARQITYTADFDVYAEAWSVVYATSSGTSALGWGTATAQGTTWSQFNSGASWLSYSANVWSDAYSSQENNGNPVLDIIRDSTGTGVTEGNSVPNTWNRNALPDGASGCMMMSDFYVDYSMNYTTASGLSDFYVSAAISVFVTAETSTSVTGSPATIPYAAASGSIWINGFVKLNVQ